MKVDGEARIIIILWGFFALFSLLLDTKIFHIVDAFVAGTRIWSDLVTPTMTTAMKWITDIGGSPLGALPFLAFAALLFRERGKVIFYILSVLVTLGGLHLVKIIVAEPRPSFVSALIVEKGFSYPSGHAAMAVAIFGLGIWLMSQRWSRPKRRAVRFVAGFIVLLIGFTRLYLGVHWLHDIVGGYLLAFAIIITIKKALSSVPIRRLLTQS